MPFRSFDLESLQELIERSRYEVIPLKGVEEKVLEFVPRDVVLTVTVSPDFGVPLMTTVPPS